MKVCSGPESARLVHELGEQRLRQGVRRNKSVCRQFDSVPGHQLFMRFLDGK
jgi:hypothetical protein